MFFPCYKTLIFTSDEQNDALKFNIHPVPELKQQRDECVIRSFSTEKRQQLELGSNRKELLGMLERNCSALKCEV